MLLLDGTATAVSYSVALLLRFEGQIPPTWLDTLRATIFLLIACRLVSSFVFRLHRWSFLLSGLTDGARVGLSGLLGTGLFMSGLYFLRLPGPPRSVIALELLLTTALMAILRFLPRLAWMYRADRVRSRRADSIRTLILGAGAAGELLLRDLRRSDEHGYQVLGFVDDDSSKQGSIVGGKPVLGRVDDLPHLVKRHQVGILLIAIPRLSAERIREILSLCSDLKLRFKILPVSYVYLQEKGARPMLHDIAPEDILPRDPIHFEAEPAAIAQRTALVTGAAGSIGSEICRQLLSNGVSKLAMVDFDENGLYLLNRRLRKAYPHAIISAEVADIRELPRLRSLFERYRPRDVFHAAAHKQVPLMETSPCEAVKNNVLGTLNAVTAADDLGTERFVLISTDKAVNPSSIMGATKRIGEMILQERDAISATKFSSVRFGNVLDSAGSVVPVFREQIASGGPVTVTHPLVERYFMTIGEAVGLVLRAAYGDFGQLCILDMGEQIRILDLARYMITMSGQAPEVDVEIVFTGLRPGEKLSEELFTDIEETTRRVDQKILVAEPSHPPERLARLLEDLIDAARREDTSTVLRLLRRLVPSYRRSAADDGGRATTAQPELKALA